LLPSVDGEQTEHYCVSNCQRSHDPETQKPPCVKCPRPVLYSVNVDAFDLFEACSTQFRVGFSGVTGLDYVAVKLVAKTLKIKFTESIFFKIRVMEKAWLDINSKIKEKEPSDGG